MSKRAWALILGLVLALTGCTRPGPPGCAWRRVTPPDLGPDGGLLWSVLAFSDSDVWVATGGTDEEYRATLFHWNGGRWSAVSSPRLSTRNNHIGVLAGSGPSDVWAAGASSPNNKGRSSKPLMLHWNGKGWSPVATPDLRSDVGGFGRLAVISEDDVWAIGSHGSRHQISPLVEHWNGRAWSVGSLPALETRPNFPNSIVAVAARSSTDIWAAGDQGSYNFNVPRSVIHWDGTAWAKVSLPSQLTFARRAPHIIPLQLNAIVPIGTGDVWFAGFGYRVIIKSGQVRVFEPLVDAAVPLLLHLSGGTWTISDLTATATRGNGYEIWSSAGLPDGRAWVVGSVRFASGINTQPLVYELRGRDWANAVTPRISPAPLHMDDGRSNGFYSVSVTPQGHVWAVGRYYTATSDGLFPLVERCS